MQECSGTLINPEPSASTGTMNKRQCRLTNQLQLLQDCKQNRPTNREEKRLLNSLTPEIKRFRLGVNRENSSSSVLLPRHPCQYIQWVVTGKCPFFAAVITRASVSDCLGFFIIIIIILGHQGYLVCCPKPTIINKHV